METLVRYLIRRLRPWFGWPQALLALAAVSSPALAAAESSLKLPQQSFFWAGVLGFLLGVRGPTYPPTTNDQRPTTNDKETRRQGDSDHASRFTHHASRIAHRAPGNTRSAVYFALWLLVACLGGVLLVVALSDALPPRGLLFEDGAALWSWATGVWHLGLKADGLPPSGTWAFLGQSLPRAWRDLMAAPYAGERGARLLVTIGGVTSVWAGALALGWALAHRRAVLGWGMPLLVALLLTTILGGGSGVALIGGLGLLLLLAIITDFRRREATWERGGIDFSDELGYDVLGWGGAAVGIILLAAALLPAWLENPLALVLWPSVEPPSGLAVLGRNIQRPRTVDPGISQLPVLQLGLSLEQAPPDSVALRVRTAAPLPDSPWPHYWRARVFNIYNGRLWTTNARVSPLEPITPAANAFAGAFVQDVEDLQTDRELIFGLPDLIGVSVPANIERLPDGAQAALTARAPDGRYRVLSRPQELAAAPPSEDQPPDMSGYLGLPPGLPPKVGETARAIVGDRTGAYNQALALESYLRALPYDYQVEPLPSNGDAVYQFLVEMRRGYCTYYASAMAVMARTLGIPARVATGYATGEYDQASGTYTIREADAHAWPELYVDGRWLPFEPTPIRPLPARSSQAAPIPPAPAPVAVSPPQQANGPLIWLVVLALVVLLTALGLRLRFPAAPAPLVTQVQARLERHGARAGVPWPPGATLHEYGALLAPRLDGAVEALYEIIELVERARYGGHKLREEEQVRLRAAGELVWARLKQRGRRA
jgi:transglutaminase-like putative cysteine protease